MNTIARTITLLALCATGASAQPFTMTWFTIDGGTSEIASGAGYTLAASIAQPDAMDAVMTGGPFTLRGGFWSAFAPTAAGCPADLDGDGDADADDFFLYLDAFATGNTGVCDLDADGDCDADDFFGYLDQFSQGC